MLKRLKFVSILLFLALVCPFGIVHATVNSAGPESNANDVQITQQNLTATGVVKDDLGDSVIGASVVVKGTTNGVATGLDGDFSIKNVKVGDIIQVSYLGYQTQEVKFQGQALTITLKEDLKLLGEVVITAFGAPKQARSVGYATTRVTTAEIERVNAVNPVAALQGKVAGVSINSVGSSGVTSSSSFTIRGAKSTSKNNAPIFVIDGMVIQEAQRGPLDGADWGSQLKNLNPADYESVQVLKGAAATALYGSRGANGAVVITTKGGKGTKRGLGIEVSQVVEFTDVYKSPIEFQNIYGSGSALNGYEGDFLPDGTLQRRSYGNSWGPRMDGRLIDQYMPNGLKTPYVAHKNNWKELYQTGVNTNTNVAISGGGEKSSFRLSYSYANTDGVYERNNFKRHTVSFRGQTELNSVFTVETGLNLAFSRAMNAASQGGWNWGQNLGMMSTYYTPRNFDMKAYNRMYRDPETHAVESTSPWNDIRNYLHSSQMNLDQRSETSILANVGLTANIAPWLTANVRANFNYYGISNLKKEYGSGAYYGPTGKGMYMRGGESISRYNLTTMLNSNNHVINIGDEKITLDASLGMEVYGDFEKNTWKKETKGGLIQPGIFAFSNSKEKIIPEVGYTPHNNESLGVFGILNLGWRDQLYMEVTGRNDWLSTLTYPGYVPEGQNNYTVFYPSVNVSWVFTEAIKMPDWFDLGRLRASWARVGMGTSAYDTVKGYGVYTQEIQYAYDRTGVAIANPNLAELFNADLKPEIQQSIEFGTDLRFLKERITLDVAYYKTNTKNQIMTLPAVLESGASKQLINAGNIQNQGVEISLEGVAILNKDIRWSIGGNFTLNRGKVKKLHANSNRWPLFDAYDGGPSIVALAGGDFGSFVIPANSSSASNVYRYNNPDDANDPRNGKKVIGYSGTSGTPNPAYVYQYVTDYDKGLRDEKVIGKVEADFLVSFNTSFSYRDFDFYALIDGRVGGNYYSNTLKYAQPMGTIKSTLHGRDKEHGGIARINYKGETVHDAIMLDAVFDTGATAPLVSDPKTLIDVAGLTYAEALDKGIMPMMASAYYTNNYGYGAPAEFAMQDNTWLCLREITIGYRVPEKITRKFGASNLRLGFTARNLGYLVNKLSDGLNPEGVSSNNPLQPVDIGGVPFQRTFAFNINVRF